MGIEYKAALVIGLPWADFDENDDLEGWLDDDVLERFSPAYDCPDEYCVFGIKYARTEDYDDVCYSVSTMVELKDEFKAITGKEGRLLLTMDIG